MTHAELGIMVKIVMCTAYHQVCTTALVQEKSFAWGITQTVQKIAVTACLGIMEVNVTHIVKKITNIPAVMMEKSNVRIIGLE